MVQRIMYTSIIHCRGTILIQKFRIQNNSRKIKVLNFQNIKKYAKNNRKYGGTPVFSEKIDCFLIFFLFFENITKFNFFSSFKVFLKTTPVAANGFFKFRLRFVFVFPFVPCRFVRFRSFHFALRFVFHFFYPLVHFRFRRFFLFS